MREPYHQLPMLPFYRTAEGEHLTLLEAARALGHVTPNPTHVLPRRPENKANFPLYERRAIAMRQGSYARPTLLREVEAVMRTPDAKILERFTKARGKAPISPAEHAEASLVALKTHLGRSWSPGCRHVVMHSSGYDTRILVGLLKHIARHRGADWLGDTRFVCFEPEIAYAKRVFDQLDWPARMWAPIDAGGAADYYADSLEFQAVGAHLSEAERFWGGPLLVERRLEGYLGAGLPLQGLSALFGDETCKWNRLAEWGDLAWFLGCYHFDNPGILPGRPECTWILPFVAAEWLDHLTTYRLPDLDAYPERIRTLLARDSANPNAIDASKLMLLDRLDPALAALPNWRFQARHVRMRNATAASPRGHLDQQIISAKTATSMETAYRASWYAHTFGPAALDYESDRTFVYWSDRNSHYIKAAIYGALLRAGVQLEK